MTNQDAHPRASAVPWNVRAELARRGIRQAQVAAVLGVAQPGVSARLRGTVQFTAAELADLAEWLGVHPGRFFDAVGATAQPLEGPSS